MLRFLHLFTAGLLLLASSVAFADMDTSADLVDEEFLDEFAFLEDAGMVESAALHRQEIGMSPSAITVLTREDIEASGATTIPDLLRLVPGMDVTVGSPAYITIASRLYWTAENWHYLVLIDGREANIELLGQTPWQVQPISLDDVERVEILRGPASSLYGANAVSGVVTITTRSVPEKTSGFARVAGGEIGMFEFAARASTCIGNWGISVSGGADLTNSFLNPRAGDKRIWKVRALAEYRWSESERLRIDAATSEGSGMVSASVGRLSADFGLRTLRLAYDSADLRGQLYWSQTPVSLHLENPLEYLGIRLATFKPITVDGHTVVGEAQWTLPELWEPLLLIVGGGGRVSWIGSDDLLDGESYTDITSSRYHESGISHFEGRAGTFVHAELAPVDWVTATGSLRFDYNTETDVFLSPRFALVLKPAAGQFFRLGVARAFRKPAFIETRIHLMAEFPDESPITGPGQDNFQEFMSRIIGNPDIGNEVLLTFDAGYLGEFLDGKLRVALDFYYNQLTNLIEVKANIVDGEQGLPNLDDTTLMHVHSGRDMYIIGSELSVRFDPSKSISLMASWAHREVFLQETGEVENKSPKNLITLGGRVRLDSGLVGSLYIFSRSEFLDATVDNPAGMLEPSYSMQMDNVFLVLSKLGWRWTTRDGFDLEAGFKLFLPVSPFSGNLFRYYEQGGGMTLTGISYGGEQLRRMVTGYLQGSF